MEEAEHAMWRSLGMSIVAAGHDVGFPRVAVTCDYAAPLRFEDEVEIQLLVAQKKSKALTYAFRLRKLNAPKPYEVARGKITVVCIKKVNGEMKATRIPKEIADKIQEAPARLLE